MRILFPALLVVLAIAAVHAPRSDAGVTDPSAQPDLPPITTVTRTGPAIVVRSWYDAWNGRRRALVIGYPAGATAPLPLVVTAHPAGMSMFCDDGNLRRAAAARFVLACLGGQGVATRAFSYGAAGQVRDLAIAPELVRVRLPRVAIDPARIALVGSSMGGMEALLVGLRYPGVYDEVVALDPVTDVGRRFGSLPPVRRVLLEAECKGPPSAQPLCYAVRSPRTLLGSARTTGTRLTVWYSRTDPVSGAPEQVPAFVAAAAGSRWGAPLRVRIGAWPHGALWDRPSGRRAWLADLGLRWSERATGTPITVRLTVRAGRVIRVG